jgi:phospholipase C
MHKRALSLSICAAVAAIGLIGSSSAADQASASKAAEASVDLSQVQNIVVIYAENRGFDHLFGHFPGANGLDNATATEATQLDRNGQPLTELPPINGNGLTDPSDPTQVPTEETRGHPNEPYALDDPEGYNVNFDYKLHDLVHRFYSNQMQINNGANNMFAAWSDAGGEVMGHYDGGNTLALWQIAQNYTLADNFFIGAFGGSFLNHQYLICACAPYDFKTANDPATFAANISAVNPDGVSLQVDPSSPASAIDGVPVFVRDSVLTPDYYGVNTMQPPYQPSGNAPATGGDPAYADPSKPNTLSPQTAQNIGDLMSQKGVSWAWYSAGMQAALDGQASSVVYQFHHQPFNYYANYAPGTAARAQHLLDGGVDGSAFISAIDAGTLPQVAFYKPEGVQNEHAGYATVGAGDAHIAEVLQHLQNSPQWAHMVVVITFDENGGWWDHVAPPKGDRWGPGTRIPAVIVSPFAKRHFVDHTQYDTASILRFITDVYGLPELPGLAQRDAALVANGHPAMGNMAAALDLAPAADAGLPLPVNSRWMLIVAMLVLAVAGGLFGFRRERS